MSAEQRTPHSAGFIHSQHQVCRVYPPFRTISFQSETSRKIKTVCRCFSFVQMSFPECVAMPSFYSENPPSIGGVHRRTALISQHMSSKSPFLSPLPHPRVGEQHNCPYAPRSSSQGSNELMNSGLKHNQVGSLQSQTFQNDFSPQRKFVSQSHTPGSSFRSPHNRSTWRRRKRDSLPALNQSG